MFQPGPLFANVVLVDEINRATPKTQSALLEAMAEHQVTVDGAPGRFPIVPADRDREPDRVRGDVPAPEAQLDRFFVRATLGYPAQSEELLIVRQQRHGHPIDGLAPVLSLDEFVGLRRSSEQIYLDDLLEEWIVELVRATRELDQVEVGASVRGSLAFAKTARTWALLQGRDHVLPADIVDLFIPVLGHRLVLRSTFLAETRHVSLADALDRIRELCLDIAPPPHPEWALSSVQPGP